MQLTTLSTTNVLGTATLELLVINADFVRVRIDDDWFLTDVDIPKAEWWNVVLAGQPFWVNDELAAINPLIPKLAP